MTNYQRVKATIEAQGLNVGCLSEELNELSEVEIGMVLEAIKEDEPSTFKFLKKDFLVEFENPYYNNERDVTVKPLNYYGEEDYE